MAQDPPLNVRSSSTAALWEWRKVRRPAGGHTNSVPKGHRWRLLPRRNARTPLAVTLSYRGGPEAWVEIHARGDLGRYPGSTAIADILADLNGGL